MALVTMARPVFAEADLKRSTDLLKRKVVAQQDFDSHKAQAAGAQAQLAADQAAEEVSRLNLEWTRVTAPGAALPGA